MRVEHTATIVIEAVSTVEELKRAFGSTLAELKLQNIPDEAEVHITHTPARSDQRDNWYETAKVNVRINW